MDTDRFTLGNRTVVTCSSDTGVADRILWVSGTGEVLVNETQVDEADLRFDPVNDSLHGLEVTCSVIRDEGGPSETVSNQTLPIFVRGENCISTPILCNR